MSEPPITTRATHDGGPGNTPPSRVVIHATCPNIGYPMASGPGAARSTARYFQSATAGGSAHYVCDGGEEQHCVPEDIIAWHAPPNPHSIGIEICAEGGEYPKSYTRAQWLSDAVWPGVLRAAARTRELCLRYSLPQVKLNSADLLAGRKGICGHADVSHAYAQSSHTDPGPAFPWVEFMSAVSQSQGAAEVELSDRLPDLYTGKPDDTLTVANTLAWAAAHAANARDRATESRDAARAVGLAMGQMRGEIADLKAQVAALVAALTKPSP